MMAMQCEIGSALAQRLASHARNTRTWVNQKTGVIGAGSPFSDTQRALEEHCKTCEVCRTLYSRREPDEKPFHLVQVKLDDTDHDRVNVNVRESGAPEETAENGHVSLDEFRRIMRDVFHFPPDEVESDVRRLKDGYGWPINMFASIESIRNSGILGVPK